MRRFLTILFVLSFAAGAYAQQQPFAWTLSGSLSNPLSITGSPVAGLVNVYLWYYCTTAPQGLASAEFDSVGSTVPLSFTTANGFLNAGGTTNLLLAVGGCPMGPVMAGNFLVYDVAGTGFNLCLAPSAANGLNVSVNCVELQMYPNDYAGYANDGTTPCMTANPSEFCLIAVENGSWSSIKSLYR